MGARPLSFLQCLHLLCTTPHSPSHVPTSPSSPWGRSLPSWAVPSSLSAEWASLTPCRNWSFLPPHRFGPGVSYGPLKTNNCGSSVVKTPHLHRRGAGRRFHPWLEKGDPACCAKNKFFFLVHLQVFCFSSFSLCFCL